MTRTMHSHEPLLLSNVLMVWHIANESGHETVPVRSVSPFLEILAKTEMSQQCHITWLHFAFFCFCLSFLFPEYLAARSTRLARMRSRSSKIRSLQVQARSSQGYLWGRGGDHTVIADFHSLSNVTLHGADTPYGFSTVPPSNNTYSPQSLALSRTLLSPTAFCYLYKEVCAKACRRISY